MTIECHRHADAWLTVGCCLDEKRKAYIWINKKIFQKFNQHRKEIIINVCTHKLCNDWGKSTRRRSQNSMQTFFILRNSCVATHYHESCTLYEEHASLLASPASEAATRIGHGTGVTKSTPGGFCVFLSNRETVSKFCEKPHQDTESLFSIDRNRSRPEKTMDPECRSRLSRILRLSFGSSRSQKFVKNGPGFRVTFQCWAVAGVCVVISCKNIGKFRLDRWW